MSCYYPQTVWRSRAGRNPITKKWPITFNVKEGYLDKEIKVPCGRCIGCRLERSRQWAIRCVHESKMHKNNAFITLTYDENNKEKLKTSDNQLTLDKRDYVLFMKRLRKEYGNGIRFFHCGEYGTQGERPHHHACIFGIDFPDKKHWSTRNGVALYRSKSLENLWPYGFSTIGDVTFESAAYVARYITKKITGSQSEEHYGEREPEYITMSRRPGIGQPWLDKFSCDVIKQDSIIMRGGLKMRPPKYYDRIYDDKKLERIKRNRQKNIDEEDNTFERMRVKEHCKKAQFKQLKRQYEGV